jgi:hypothetical protein
MSDASRQSYEQYLKRYALSNKDEANICDTYIFGASAKKLIEMYKPNDPIYSGKEQYSY